MNLAEKKLDYKDMRLKKCRNFIFLMLVNNFPIKMLTTSITNAGTNHAIPSDERGNLSIIC